LGLVLAAGLLIDAREGSAAQPQLVGYVGVVGAGLAVAAGLTRLAPPPGFQSRVVRLGPGGVSVAAALGLAVWVLAHQVVVPTTALSRTDLGGVPVLASGLLLAAVAIVAFFLIERRANA
jgi:hypothetical protein